MTSDFPKPFFTRRKLIGIAIGFPLAVILTLAGLLYLGYSSLESQLEALRAEGLPMTASELNDFYAVPDGVTDSTELWVTAIDAAIAANLSQQANGLPFVSDGPTPIPAPGEAWAELEASRTLLNELDSELQATWAAAEAGGQVRFPVDFSAGIATLLPRTQDSRQCARLLLLDAHVSAHDGNPARVLKDLRAMFALSDALRGEPIMISQLVRIALHAMGCEGVKELLPHCDWSDADLESLQRSIQSARFRDEMSRAFSGERAIVLTELDRMLLGPFRPANQKETLHLFRSSVDGMSHSWVEALDRQQELGNRLKRLVRASRFNQFSLSGLALFQPAMEQACVAGVRATVRQRCANAGIAAARFRLKHGRWPKSLEEIAKEFLGAETSTLLIDPFNGQPLRFKTDETSIVIYSVGANGLDDGGNFEFVDFDPLDIGFTVKK